MKQFLLKKIDLRHKMIFKLVARFYKREVNSDINVRI